MRRSNRQAGGGRSGAGHGVPALGELWRNKARGYEIELGREEICSKSLKVKSIGVDASSCLRLERSPAKPMVLYESDDFVALASEEVAIRSIFPHEIDTFDPYEGEVRVWQL